MALHKIDRQFKKPTDLKLQQVMVFCLLDSNSTYKQVCKAYDGLMKVYYDGKGTDKNGEFKGWCDETLIPEFFGFLGYHRIRHELKASGYPWYNQKARYLVRWARSKYSKPEYLRSMPREELAKNITGIGRKLASMYVRNTRGEQVAVLDRHIINWLKERHSWVRNRIRTIPKNWFEYVACENYFIQDARELGKSPYRLDIEIWEERRVK